MFNFWHYNARLEADGFQRLASAEDAAATLGAQWPVSAIGYVFSDEWAAENPSVRFLFDTPQPVGRLGNS